MMLPIFILDYAYTHRLTNVIPIGKVCGVFTIKPLGQGVIEFWRDDEKHMDEKHMFLVTSDRMEHGLEWVRRYYKAIDNG
jgi:hypothetical protein